jgi:hypothetical protein
MAATDLRDPLADSVLAVIGQASPILSDNLAVRIDIDVPNRELLQVKRQQLRAMGINTAQIGDD